MKKAIMLLLVSVFLVMPLSSFAGNCGDVDNSGSINILDVTCFIDYLYKSGPEPDCGTSYPGICGDVDNSEAINILDITYLINYLYKGGPEPDCGEITGTIVIDPSPDALNAPWSLAGPSGYNNSGNGDATLPELEPGEYTITWGAVAGWITPSNSTQTLPGDGTITFTGTYVEEPVTGTIVIDPSPDALNAPWSLAGPSGYNNSGNGDATLPELEPGEYTITWGAVAGWITPPGEMQTLTAGATITFTGTYVEEPVTGTIVIDPSPDALNAPWSLAGPSGYINSGNGDATLPELEPGEYTITWGAVAGWITPSNSTQTLPGDGTITFTGTYVEEGSGTVTDIDGNVYQTVTIGTQVWMAENLKVTHYRNGDPIPNVTDAGTWSGLTTGAYCEQDNNPANVATYGRLYNWYAVTDSRNIAPTGWHVPTDEEIKQLEIYLGMSQTEADAAMRWRGTDEGGKLKETGTTHWSSPNTGATNESGFTALPGGYRRNSGTFRGEGNIADFWCSMEYNESNAWRHSLQYNTAQVFRGFYAKEGGLSIRCVKD